MKILKTISFKWWQIGIVKVCLISFGIILGVYFTGYLLSWVNLFWLLFIISAIYLIVDWWRQ